WFGVRTPDESLLTNLQALIGFGSAFGFGWLLHRQIDLLRILEKRWLIHLAFAIGLIAMSFLPRCARKVGLRRWQNGNHRPVLRRREMRRLPVLAGNLVRLRPDVVMANAAAPSEPSGAQHQAYQSLAP